MKVSSSHKRLFVLGLDGFPHSFAESLFKKGEMQAFESVTRESAFKRMNSVYPTISSVAWASYMTGTNPGTHGIFGFVERDPNPFSVRIPTAAERKAPSIWRKLSDEGKKVIVINVPLTYPPEEVNGILISDFLCTDIRKATYPAELAVYLESKGYIIDVDAWLARESKDKFAEQVMLAMDKRFEVAFDLMDREIWDFFQLHIMETDRLFHFFYSDLEKGQYNSFVRLFFKKLDNYIEQLKERLSSNDAILILSDHGFCAIEREVQLNEWLERENLLKFESSAKKRLEGYDTSSTAYSMIPGRIFLNLKGRESKGSVRMDQYNEIRGDIKKKLLAMKDEATGAPVIEKVFYREEIYSGPYLESASDLIVHPNDGYDIKAKIGGGQVFEKTALNGMHTYDDALICGSNFNVSDTVSIQDVFCKIIDFYRQ